MAYKGAYPKVKCVSPAGTTKDMLLSALYDQNAHCAKCSSPFIDDDVCCWDGTHRIEHVDCFNPEDPGNALIRSAEERIKRANQT